MKIVRIKLNDSLVTTGILLIVVSLFIFCVPIMTTIESSSYFNLFTLNFSLSALYFILLLIKKRVKQEEHKRHYNILLLILFLISAYALNREIEVFNTSVNWLAILLIIVCSNYVLSLFFNYMHRLFKHCIFFLFGIGAVLFLYLSIYVMPLYMFSIMVLPVLGISVHTFIPILFLIYTFLLANDFAKKEKSYWVSLIAGITLSIAAILFYCLNWHANITSINKAYNESITNGHEGLPSWIRVAQQIPHNSFTGDILKANLVYTVPSPTGNIFWDMPNRNFNEGRQYHDPLIVMASIFSGTSNLPEQDRINILKSQFDARHDAEEKLWSGKDLVTQNVVTNVRIWPQFRIAYTEKIITVYNQSEVIWFRDQQEALYSFQLPEGSVITSLSLWIDGQEEKGVLTTKGKADSAYTTIVGKELRDPSVVHWQEGNKVTVRVFPVLSNSNRVFKLGITSPLKKKEDKLLYENITFKGPAWQNASEEIKVEVDSPTEVIEQANLTGTKSLLKRSGRYDPYWFFSLKDVGLSSNSFCFKGYRYDLKPVKTQRLALDVTDVYLDINKAWTRDEIELLLSLSQSKRVWVYQNRLIELKDAENEIISALLAQNFSLFPFHQIADPRHSLVITKSQGPTPNLSDIQQSQFIVQLKQWSKNGEKVYLFNMSESLSDYLKALKEYRFFNYQSGTLEKALSGLHSGKFSCVAESTGEVMVEDAGMAVVKSEEVCTTQAPDHVARLFAYNHIMQQLGQEGFAGAETEDRMIEEAIEFNVVSPISSLVVLEKKDDYERFSIEASKDGLNNATLHSKGAVPEPHEWLLILITAGIAIYLYSRSKL